MGRSIAASRRTIDGKPDIDLSSVRIGERHLIAETPVIVTALTDDGVGMTLEGWSATSGELLIWRWPAHQPEERRVPDTFTGEPARYVGRSSKVTVRR